MKHDDKQQKQQDPKRTPGQHDKERQTQQQPGHDKNQPR